MIEYKGYIGTVGYEPDDKCFHGEVIGLSRDGIHFEGTTPDEIEQAFRDSVDDYLDYCAEQGVEPDKAYSGKIALRVEPENHRKAAMRAQAEGLSISKWIEQLIQAAD